MSAYFNPQGPHGPRRCAGAPPATPSSISIHKALTGLDLPLFSLFLIPTIFQSTRPSRASTSTLTTWREVVEISIHKALTGLDMEPKDTITTIEAFQSTRPSRASTCTTSFLVHPLSISIHKALTGLDALPERKAKQ